MLEGDNKKEAQVTNTILMVRPAFFGFNHETADNNAFQVMDAKISDEKIHRSALKEFDGITQLLKSKGVDVVIEEDTSKPRKPDAIFPNNWISFHENGSIITYPMFSPIRRKERREAIVKQMTEKFGFDRRYSLEQYEDQNTFLEGTGSMVLDRSNHVVYACLSPRTDPTVLDKFCTLLDYDRMVFTAVDRDAQPIYHTNVMMSVGERFAVVCLDSISNLMEREELEKKITESGKELIEISMNQLHHFAGNLLQLKNMEDQALIVMSKQAYKSLSPGQIDRITGHGEIVHATLDTIEKFGGGSARCMIAEIFRPHV